MQIRNAAKVFFFLSPFLVECAWKMWCGQLQANSVKDDSEALVFISGKLKIFAAYRCMFVRFSTAGRHSFFFFCAEKCISHKLCGSKRLTRVYPFLDAAATLLASV